jgi:NAD(P)H-hydrate epimerase
MADAYLTRYWAQKIDERAVDEFDMVGLVLMENAGRGCADLLDRLGIDGTVVICCGKGNNAGDGLVMARHLDLRGYRVKVLLWCAPESLRGDASRNYEIARRAELPLVACPARSDAAWLRGELGDADWIVDALLGTGSRGEPRPPLDAVIDVLNDHPARKLAVDLPSGLDCDTGEPASHVFRADHTATFVAPKAGFRSAAARPLLGTVHVLDIGAPRLLVQEILARAGSD